MSDENNNEQKINIEANIKSFESLLQDIQNLDDKKRRLWLEIYSNALFDRQNAYANYITIVGICADKSSEHAIHGRSIAAYLERMGKANDQLLKLADLVARAQEQDKPDDNNDPNDIYATINNKKHSFKHAS